MDALTYLKTWLCSFCTAKTVNSESSNPSPEIKLSPKYIADYKVSKHALEVISDRVINTVKGKEAIQAIGEPKYLLNKDDINLIVEHAVMGTFEDIEEFLSTYKGRRLV